MGTSVDLMGLRAGRRHSELLGAYGVTFGKFLFISVHSSCPIAKPYCPTMLSKISQMVGCILEGSLLFACQPTGGSAHTRPEI